MGNSVNLFGRKISLTKSGGINKTYLKKDEKSLVKEFENKQKAENKETKLKELEAFFGGK